MSSSLHWYPVMPEKHNSASDKLKYIFKELWPDIRDHHVLLGHTNMEALRAVRASIPEGDDDKEIEKMLEAIEQYGGIEIWLAY